MTWQFRALEFRMESADTQNVMPVPKPERGGTGITAIHTRVTLRSAWRSPWRTHLDGGDLQVVRRRHFDRATELRARTLDC